LKSQNGFRPLYILSSILFAVAILGIITLVGNDIAHGYSVSIVHQRLDAWPLMAIGLSYIVLQLASKQKTGDRIKNIFLGVAFLFWGGEQLLPPSRIVTLLDEGAVTIFVVDLSFIIWGRISQTESS
jgi:hypothetical protein